VEQRNWTFRRGDEQLVLQRHADDENGALTLVVMANGSVSTIPFKDESALIVFQTDMEELLVRTGWVLQECTPERRRKRVRRGVPRITNDRRRWWTDPVGDAGKVEGAAVTQARGDRRAVRGRVAKDRRS
jgi:hypothetical protein